MDTSYIPQLLIDNICSQLQLLQSKSEDYNRKEKITI